MTLTLFLLYVSLAATLMRSILVRAHVVPPSCGRCGLPFERRELGERVCACHSS
ncbi:MAG: hypothetical protein ACRDN6_15590 [Gaiellaceae bacterium]